MDLTPINDLLNRRARLGGTHYDGCHGDHIDCAALALLGQVHLVQSDLDRLRDALQRIATYEIPGTGVYRNTDAAEYARRVLGCEHEHMDGVDSKDLADPDKVWRCVVCGAEETNDPGRQTHAT